MKTLIEVYKKNLNEEQTIQVFKQIRYVLSLFRETIDELYFDMENLIITEKLLSEFKKIINILISMLQEDKIKYVNFINANIPNSIKIIPEYSAISNRFDWKADDAAFYDEMYRLDWRYQYIKYKVN